MAPVNPWPAAEILQEWRSILDLMDRPEAHTDFSPALLEAVRRNRMEALIYQRFAERGIPPPAWAAQPLKAASYARRYFYERYRDLALDLYARFADARIPCLFVKGIVVAPWFYNPPYLRPFADIDVIVPFEAVERGTSILEALEFEALHRRELSRREREYIHALEFIHRGDSNLSVELHHDLGVYSFHPGWHRKPAYHALSPGEGLPTLALEAHVLFLCAHLYYRHYTQAHLIWLHDIHEAVTRYRGCFNWEAFRRLAERTGWGRGAARVLSALEIYPDWAPPETCRGLEDVPSLRELVHLPREKFDLFVAMGGYIPTWRGRLAFLMFHLCPPKAVLVQRYRLHHPSLWFLCYPLRWADITVRGTGWALRRLFKGGPPA